MDTSPKAILAFMDHSLSSDLPEETRQRRIEVSLKVMQTHPYLLWCSLLHALRACSTESAIVKFVDFVLLADEHANDQDSGPKYMFTCKVYNRDCHQLPRMSISRSLPWLVGRRKPKTLRALGTVSVF